MSGKGFLGTVELFSPQAELDFDAVGQSARPARILLAEDDREMRRLLSSTLWNDGYHVVEAETGVELLDYLNPYIPNARVHGRLLAFDGIISDVRMPGLTGLEVLSLLRRYDPSTPVILITAFGDEETHAEAHRLGAVAVLDKPFDMEVLRARLWNAVPPR
jgi:CheY-like chemotaxis protein